MDLVSINSCTFGYIVFTNSHVYMYIVVYVCMCLYACFCTFIEYITFHYHSYLKISYISSYKLQYAFIEKCLINVSFFLWLTISINIVTYLLGLERTGETRLGVCSSFGQRLEWHAGEQAHTTTEDCPRYEHCTHAR